jgi:hypothetical protein
MHISPTSRGEGSTNENAAERSIIGAASDMARVPLTLEGDRVVAIGATFQPRNQERTRACDVSGDLVSALRRVKDWLDSEPAQDGRLVGGEKRQMRALVMDALAKAEANRAAS